MRDRNSRALLRGFLATAAMIVPFASAAAQIQPPEDDAAAQVETGPGVRSPAAPEEDGTIVVTGTSIRGIAPTGANSISVSKAEIEATGATSASQVLATIPQLGAGGGVGNFFNAIPQLDNINALAVGPNAQTTQRPSLRPVPGASQDSGNSTLVLIDGNRVAGAGVNSNSPSPDSVPPALLERVELITDGASAVYGSDAIAGVINYITVRRFDGVEANANYSFGKDYHSWDANLVVGKDWGSGSAFISYGHAYAAPLYNRDRDYVAPLDYSTGLERDLACETPNVRIAANAGNSLNPALHYLASTATGVSGSPFTVVAPLVGTPNLCRLNRDGTLSARAKRDNVLGSITQEFGPVTVTVRGHYNFNSQRSIRQMATYTATINSTNPYFRPVAETVNGNPITSYAVLGSFAPAFGREAYTFSNSSKRYGGSAELTWDVGHDWQIRMSGIYDMSDSDLVIPVVTAAAVNGAFNTNAASACSVLRTTAACLNPFNIAASDPALLSTIFTSVQYGEGHDRLLDFKTVADGPLFALPGGDVRMAIGVEYFRDKFTRGNYTGLVANLNNSPTGTPPGLFTPSAVLSNKSIFAEINVPVVTSANEMAGIRELRLAASGRYDHYSRFGGTFNPRIGASYKPVEWLTLRGSWNTSFRAPSALDILGSTFANSTVSDFAATQSNGTAQIFVDPARPIPAAMGGPTSTTARVLVVQGTDPNITPQTGEGYSFAAEFTPIPRLSASISYYRIDFKGQFGSPCQNFPCYPFTPQYEVILPTPAQIAAFKLQGVGGTNILVPDNLIYGLVDTRKTNLGNSYIRGLDYAVRYSFDTGFGTLFGSVSGNLQLESKQQVAATTPFVNTYVVLPQSKHRMIVQLGATSGGLRATATLQHTAGYQVTRSASVLQDKVGAYDVVNLAANYRFEGEDWATKGLELSLVINNAFDTDPPFFATTNGTGYANGSTIGRVFVLGLTKKF